MVLVHGDQIVNINAMGVKDLETKELPNTYLVRFGICFCYRSITAPHDGHPSALKWRLI